MDELGYNLSIYLFRRVPRSRAFPAHSHLLVRIMLMGPSNVRELAYLFESALHWRSTVEGIYSSKQPMDGSER